MHKADKKNMIIITIIVLVLIAVVVATVMIMLNSKENEEDSKNDVSTENNQVAIGNNNEDDGGYINMEEDETDDDESQNNVNSFEVQAFNAQFTVYQGEISGAQFKTLINTAISSNSANPEHQVNPTTNNLESFANIDETQIYVVTLSYDDEGYVNSINIDKKVEETQQDALGSIIDSAEDFINSENNNITEDELQTESNNTLNNTLAIRTFNSMFISFEGPGRSASEVRALISAVNASNTSNPEHQVAINITGNDIKTTVEYLVEVEYGNDGYINNIKVTEIQ